MSSLYLEYFGLNSPPFSITPDPGFFFEGKDRGVFIAGLLHAAVQADGIVLVIGEVGSGKTLMSRLLLARLPDNVDTVYLPNPSFSHDEIIDVIASDLGIAVSRQGARLETLQQELIKRHELGRQVVVLVDEAHAMPVESIEEIRRLSNLETDERKLVQLILCGQPELDTLLATPRLRQVRDRVVYRLMLRNLSRSDSSAYLDHRLRVAGWRGGRMFSRLGEWLLLRDARGRARRLNLIADKALLAAFADGKKQVKARHVLLAIRDIGANFSSALTRWRIAAAWLFSIVVTAVTAVWLTSMFQRIETSSSLPAQVLATQAQKSPSTHLSHTTEPINSHPPTGALEKDPASGDKAASSVPGFSHSTDSKIAPSTGKSNTESLREFQTKDLDQLVKASYANAQQQANFGSYAIQLASVKRKSDVAAFISVFNKTLAPEHIYVRRFSSNQATWYAIYFGNIPTLEAANRLVAGLARELIEAKPIIRTWKNIRDADWVF